MQKSPVLLTVALKANVEKLSESNSLHLYQYSLKSCQIPKKIPLPFSSNLEEK